MSTSQPPSMYTYTKYLHRNVLLYFHEPMAELGMTWVGLTLKICLDSSLYYFFITKISKFCNLKKKKRRIIDQ